MYTMFQQDIGNLYVDDTSAYALKTIGYSIGMNIIH